METTPPPPGRFPPPFYWFASTVVRWLLRVFYGLRVSGQEHVPRQGGCVIGMNHMSSWDPPVLGVTTPREIHVMAKKELFRTWIVRRVLRGLRVFPIDRAGNDIGAIKEALRRLQRGHAVGIFFEGTRNVGAGSADAHQGAAFLAQRAGVPIVPGAIWREGRRFHVAFGTPLQPTGRTREETAELTAELAAAAYALMPSRT
ncbi:MAG: lysophospholipid acyltransferase family protein [bacterium]|nr:lysophospholipid acyltransferase family protein [bacterium]